MDIDDTLFFKRVRAIEEHMEQLLRSFEAVDPFVAASITPWRPPTDVFEVGDAIVVRMELPGIPSPSEDIEVVVEDDALTVRGIRRDLHPEPKQSYHLMEIRYGVFERVLKLPDGLDTTRAKGQYTDGFLVLTIPKAKSCRPSSIKIKIGETVER